MSMTFEGETLNIDGKKISGTIIVETRVTNSSFDHAFGTEYLTEVEYTPGGFEPDKKVKLDPKAVNFAVSVWIDNNLELLGREFDKQSGD